MAMPHPDKQSIGLAGEFFVAAELQRRGVSVSLQHGASTDVLVSNADLGLTAIISVTTTTTDSWVLNKDLAKQDIVLENRFLALVRLPGNDEPPTIYLFGSWEFPELFNQAKGTNLRTIAVRKVQSLLPEGGGWEKVLSKVGRSARKPVFGSAKGEVKLAPDFNETPEEFSDYS